MRRLTSLLRRQPEPEPDDASPVLDLTLDDLHRPGPDEAGRSDKDAAPESDDPPAQADAGSADAGPVDEGPAEDPQAGQDPGPDDRPDPAASPDLRALGEEIAVLAGYVGRLRREIAALGPDRLADATLPAAQDDLRNLQVETQAAANAILTAADALLAAQPRSLDQYRTEVASQVAAIRAACVFGPAVDDRLARTLSVLNGLGTRLARVGEAAAGAPAAGPDVSGEAAATRPVPA